MTKQITPSFIFPGISDYSYIYIEIKESLDGSPTELFAVDYLNLLVALCYFSFSFLRSFIAYYYISIHEYTLSS